jgi:DDE superfamily endonuclease
MVNKTRIKRLPRLAPANPHNTYTLTSIQWEHLFNIADALPHRDGVIHRYWNAVSAAAAAAKTPIKKTAFVSRYLRWRANDPSASGNQRCNTHTHIHTNIYVLNHIYLRVGDDRGKNRALFTPDEENKLAVHFRLRLDMGEPMGGCLMRLTFSDYYDSIVHHHHHANGHHVAIPTFSDPFVSGFCQRNDFYFGSGRLVPRVAITPSPAVINDWKLRFYAWANEYPANRIFNMDETSWPLQPALTRLLHESGSRAKPTVEGGVSKSAFTIMVTVAASGAKLPVMLVAKGKTELCMSKFDVRMDSREAQCCFSETGWTRSAVMIEYLKVVVQPYLAGEPGLLVLDNYSAHCTAEVKACAEAMNVKLFCKQGALCVVCCYFSCMCVYLCVCVCVCAQFYPPTRRIYYSRWMLVSTAFSKENTQRNGYVALTTFVIWVRRTTLERHDLPLMRCDQSVHPSCAQRGARRCSTRRPPSACRRRWNSALPPQGSSR